jgi:hypothetical protein
MTEPSRSVHWERLAVLRSPLLLLIGMVLLCVAAFMWDVRAGLTASGISVILIAFLTDGPAPSGQEVRR